MYVFKNHKKKVMEFLSKYWKYMNPAYTHLFEVPMQATKRLKARYLTYKEMQYLIEEFELIPEIKLS